MIYLYPHVRPHGRRPPLRYWPGWIWKWTFENAHASLPNRLPSNPLSTLAAWGGEWKIIMPFKGGFNFVIPSIRQQSCNKYLCTFAEAVFFNMMVCQRFIDWKNASTFWKVQSFCIAGGCAKRRLTISPSFLIPNRGAAIVRSYQRN